MSKQRSKGTGFETSVLPAFQKYMPTAHRLGAQGVNDRGDLWLPDPRYIPEIKCFSSYAGKLAGWLAEAEVEAANAGKPHGIVVFKRGGTTDPLKQYCLTTLGSQLELIHGSQP